MAKKSKNNPVARNTAPTKQVDPALNRGEQLFKSILKVMSWIVGLSFVAIIILPNFNFPLLDISVKIIFYLGIITLLLFIVLEMFGTTIKKMLGKLM